MLGSQAPITKTEANGPMRIPIPHVLTLSVTRYRHRVLFGAISRSSGKNQPTNQVRPLTMGCALPGDSQVQAPWFFHHHFWRADSWGVQMIPSQLGSDKSTPQSPAFSCFCSEGWKQLSFAFAILPTRGLWSSIHTLASMNFDFKVAPTVREQRHEFVRHDEKRTPCARIGLKPLQRRHAGTRVELSRVLPFEADWIAAREGCLGSNFFSFFSIIRACFVLLDDGDLIS